MTDDQWERSGRERHPNDRRLVMERLRGLAAPVGIVLAAMMVVFLSYRGPLLGAIAAFVATIVVVLWLRNRATDEDREEYGPGANDG